MSERLPLQIEKCPEQQAGTSYGDELFLARVYCSDNEHAAIGQGLESLPTTYQPVDERLLECRKQLEATYSAPVPVSSPVLAEPLRRKASLLPPGKQQKCDTAIAIIEEAGNYGFRESFAQDVVAVTHGMAALIKNWKDLGAALAAGYEVQDIILGAHRLMFSGYPLASRIVRRFFEKNIGSLERQLYVTNVNGDGPQYLILSVLNDLNQGTKRQKRVAFDIVARNVDQIAASATPLGARYVENVLSDGFERGNAAEVARAKQTVERFLQGAFDPAGASYNPDMGACMLDFTQSRAPLDATEKLHMEQTAMRAAERYGLDGRRLLRAWERSDNDLAHSIPDHFKAMVELEKRRPGIAKLLTTEYVLFCFGRYPADALVRQYDMHARGVVPHGTIVYPRGDHSRIWYAAFNGTQKLLGSICQQMHTNGETNHEVFFYEAATLEGALACQAHDTQLHGKSLSLIWGGHGTEFGEGLMFSDDPGGTVTDLDAGQAAALLEQLGDNPIIVLISCSTGAPDGLNAKLNRSLGVRTLAPNAPAEARSAKVNFAGDGSIDFDFDFSGAVQVKLPRRQRLPMAE